MTVQKIGEEFYLDLTIDEEFLNDADHFADTTVYEVVCYLREAVERFAAEIHSYYPHLRGTMLEADRRDLL